MMMFRWVGKIYIKIAKRTLTLFIYDCESFTYCESGKLSLYKFSKIY